MDIDFEKEPLATLDDGKEVVELDTMEDEPLMCQVFLRDIWPSRTDIQAVESKYVIPRMFEVNNRHSDEAPLSTQYKSFYSGMRHNQGDLERLH